MIEPPLGMCFPVKYVRCRDGDTPVMEMRTGQEIAIRLMGVDTPEVKTTGSERATAELNWILSQAKTISLWIPLPDPGKDGRIDMQDLFGVLSFDRIPGRLFADGEDVSETIILKGLGRRV